VQDIVMVVEDDEQARNLLSQILEFEGFSVIGFANGAEALAHLEKSEPPCLIILDIRMPVMDGPEFRAALLKVPRLAKIPAVVVTAFDPSAASQLSALRVFKKPVDVDALLGFVRENC